MKTRALQVTMVMMLLATALFAQKTTKDEVFTSMILKGTNKVEIRMMIPDKDAVMLYVYDENDSRIFSKRIKNVKDVLVKHDISVFPDGVYTYEIVKDKKVITSTPIVKAHDKALVYKPIENLSTAKR
jgi:hypothetical protein